MYLIIGDEDEAADFEEKLKKDPKEAVQYFIKHYGKGPGPASYEDVIDDLKAQDIDVKDFE